MEQEQDDIEFKLNDIISRETKIFKFKIIRRWRCICADNQSAVFAPTKIKKKNGGTEISTTFKHLFALSNSKQMFEETGYYKKE